MLVLSRKKEEVIVIADCIEISVVEIRGDKVKIGISAPMDVAVDRKEVWEAKRRNNAEYANSLALRQAPLPSGEAGENNQSHANGSKELFRDQIKSGPKRKPGRRA